MDVRDGQPLRPGAGEHRPDRVPVRSRAPGGLAGLLSAYRRPACGRARRRHDLHGAGDRASEWQLDLARQPRGPGRRSGQARPRPGAAGCRRQCLCLRPRRLRHQADGGAGRLRDRPGPHLSGGAGPADRQPEGRHDLLSGEGPGRHHQHRLPPGGEPGGRHRERRLQPDRGAGWRRQQHDLLKLSAPEGPGRQWRDHDQRHAQHRRRGRDGERAGWRAIARRSHQGRDAADRDQHHRQCGQARDPAARPAWRAAEPARRQDQGQRSGGLGQQHQLRLGGEPGARQRAEQCRRRDRRDAQVQGRPHHRGRHHPQGADAGARGEEAGPQ